MVPLLLILAACSSPPADLQERSDGVSQQLTTTQETIDANKKEFNSLLKGDDYSFMSDYTEEQLHKDRFGEASAKLKEASATYEERVKPLLGTGYEDSKRAELETALADVEKLVTEANALAADPVMWLARVADTKDNASTLVEKARTASNAMVTDLALFGEEIMPVVQAFPAQDVRIATMDADLDQMKSSALDALADADAELAKTRPNYALLATSLTDIEGLSKSYADASGTYRADIATLTDTETHTLLDIRVDSFLEVSRTSWDENSDAFTDTDYEYDLGLTDQEAATYFADKIGQVVAFDSYWGGFELSDGIDKEMWDKLKIDPAAEWPGWHNMAEYYIDGLEDVYCQKLKVLNNGEPDASGRPDPAQNYCSQYDTKSEIANGIYWIDAEELNAEAIGMDIYSKAYGDFADQATTAATPPGMAYVGDPATGEWREDSNGNSFWYYYGQYAFFSQLIGGPNSYHYRNEYDTWNRDYRRQNEAYYATAGGTPRYGAHSPQVSSRFPNSTYVKSGLVVATVRNAGPAARAGGPGNGGK